MKIRNIDDFSGRQTKMLRKRLNMTQDVMADRLSLLSGMCITKPMISNWERGKTCIPSPVLPYLCKALKCTLEDLVVAEPLMDEGYHLPATVATFSRREKEILHYILTQWSGERWPLLELLALYAVQPKEYRGYIITTIVESYKDCLHTCPEEVDNGIHPNAKMVMDAYHDLIETFDK